MAGITTPDGCLKGLATVYIPLGTTRDLFRIQNAVQRSNNEAAKAVEKPLSGRRLPLSLLVEAAKFAELAALLFTDHNPVNIIGLTALYLLTCTLHNGYCNNLAAEYNQRLKATIISKKK